MSYTNIDVQPQEFTKIDTNKLRKILITEIILINGYARHIANSNMKEINEVWTSCMAYLSTIKYASTNEILSYHLSKRITLDISTETIEKLIKGNKNLLHPEAFIHSDQGTHYRGLCSNGTKTAIGNTYIPNCLKNYKYCFLIYLYNVA